MDEFKEIKGGAFQVARKLFDSELWINKPATWKILWIYILGKVNHKDNGVCERGEGFFRWAKEIYLVGPDLAPDIIKKAVHFFKNRSMVSTRRSTRGVYIKVLNYNRYQMFDNYVSTTKSTTGSTREALEKHQRSTPINKNVRMKERKEDIVADDSGFNLEEYLDKIIQNKEETTHVRLIAYYIKKRGIDAKSKEEVSQIISRHSPYAVKVSKFDKKRVYQAILDCEDLKDNNGKPIAYTFETIYKLLTK